MSSFIFTAKFSIAWRRLYRYNATDKIYEQLYILANSDAKSSILLYEINFSFFNADVAHDMLCYRYNYLMTSWSIRHLSYQNVWVKTLLIDGSHRAITSNYFRIWSENTSILTRISNKHVLYVNHMAYLKYTFKVRFNFPIWAYH